MKVRFVVTLVGSTLGFALSAFADEAPIAASSTQAAISVESDGSTGHQAIKDHRARAVSGRVESVAKPAVRQGLDVSMDRSVNGLK
jgi:hypothetical protein